MPTYEFRCTACGHQFEVFQSMSAPDPAECEGCHAAGTLEKVLFPVAVHYKGSGFYSTDYSGKGGSGSGSSGDSGAASSSSDAPASSDSTGSSSGSSTGSDSSTSTASSTD
jgi:putative FmdB family regulatory protein